MALKELTRRRVRLRRKILNLNYLDFETSVLEEQKRISDELFENGELSI